MKSIFIYLDGMRYDYIYRMLFLKRLFKKSLSGKLKVEPFHQFEFSIFTSKKQSSHNLWVWYYYNPKTSPYKWIKWLHPFIPFKEKRITRNMLTYLTSIFMFFSGRTRFVKLANIPLNKAYLFHPLQKNLLLIKNQQMCQHFLIFYMKIKFRTLHMNGL